MCTAEIVERVVRRRALDRQRKKERCSSVHAALGPHAPSVTSDDAMHDRQAHTGAAELVGPMQTLKDAEELADILHIESDSIVPDQIDDFAAGAGRGDLDAR